MKIVLPYSVVLTLVLVADMIQNQTGSFPMELEFPAKVANGIYTEPEVRVRYVCIVEEVEWPGSTAVRYLIQ